MKEGRFDQTIKALTGFAIAGATVVTIGLTPQILNSVQNAYNVAENWNNGSFTFENEDVRSAILSSYTENDLVNAIKSAPDYPNIPYTTTDGQNGEIEVNINGLNSVIVFNINTGALLDVR